MKYMKTHESFLGLFGDTNPNKELAKFREMEEQIEFPKKFDPYLFDYYISSLHKLIKYAKKKDLSLLKQIDINKTLMLFNIVKKQQRLLPSTIEDLENCYDMYDELTNTKRL